MGAVLINTSESMEREVYEWIRVVVVHTFRIGPHTRENVPTMPVRKCALDDYFKHLINIIPIPGNVMDSN